MRALLLLMYPLDAAAAVLIFCRTNKMPMMMMVHDEMKTKKG